MKLVLNTDFFSQSSIIFAGAFVVNVLNYIFTLAMSRILPVEAFGEVAALSSLLVVISVPAGALAMLMTREIASRSGQGRESARDLFLFLQKHVSLAALGMWLLFLVCVPFLSRFLHIPLMPFFIFSAIIPLSAFGALQGGTLQGLQFFVLSKQNVLNTSVKLLAAVALVMAGFSVSGVVAALVLAQAAAWVYGYFATHTALGIEKGTPRATLDTSSIGTFFLAILVTTFLLTLLSNADILLAKHFLPPLLAGQYGALSTVGKIIIYGIGAFTTVLLPMASAAHARGQGEERRILALSLAVIAAASIAGWALFTLFPGLVVSTLFGARYMPIVPFLGLFSVAMGCIALATALINYFVAIRNTSFMYLLGFGILLEVVLISLSHGSLGAITEMLVASSAILLVLIGGKFSGAQKDLKFPLDFLYTFVYYWI